MANRSSDQRPKSLNKGKTEKFSLLACTNQLQIPCGCNFFRRNTEIVSYILCKIVLKILKYNFLEIGDIFCQNLPQFGEKT